MTEVFYVMYRTGYGPSQDQRLETFATRELADRYVTEFGTDPHYTNALYVAPQDVYTEWSEMEAEIARRFAVTDELERSIREDRA
jgi:hypothetical protein